MVKKVEKEKKKAAASAGVAGSEKEEEIRIEAFEKLIKALIAVGGENEFYEIYELIDNFRYNDIPDDLIDFILTEWAAKIGYGQLKKNSEISISKVLSFCMTPNLIVRIKLGMFRARCVKPSSGFILDVFERLVRARASAKDVQSALGTIFDLEQRFTIGMIFDAVTDQLQANEGIVSGIALFFMQRHHWKLMASIVTWPVQDDVVSLVYEGLCHSGRVSDALQWVKMHRAVLGEKAFSTKNLEILATAVSRRKQLAKAV